MKVRILRQNSPEDQPHWETFDYNGPEDASVAAVLDYINYNDDIETDDGKKTSRIIWDCSCLQGICGACAIVINDRPALACETFIRDLKKDVLVLRPLRKFPVIRDLMVDRSSIQENLKKSGMFIGEYSGSDEREHDHQYSVSKCLKCGLCLEVCPNYVNGKTFFGAAFANDCYVVASRNSAKSDEIRKTYAEHFGSGCSKSLSCMDVCPMKIQTIASIAKMNRMKNRNRKSE